MCLFKTYDPETEAEKSGAILSTSCKWQVVWAEMAVVAKVAVRARTAVGARVASRGRMVVKARLAVGRCHCSKHSQDIETETMPTSSKTSSSTNSVLV